MSEDLTIKPCPCGKTPPDLTITDAGQGGKWALVSGDCCGEWNIEFRTEYNVPESESCRLLGLLAWNEAPRG